jgi:hypothetical protein
MFEMQSIWSIQPLKCVETTLSGLDQWSLNGVTAEHCLSSRFEMVARQLLSLVVEIEK